MDHRTSEIAAAVEQLATQPRETTLSRYDAREPINALIKKGVTEVI